MKILVGSENPVKIYSAKEAFSKFFDNVDVIGIKVNSQVPDQPINSDTFKGAENRARNLGAINQSNRLNADYFVGIEGGIAESFGRWLAFGGICIIDKQGNEGFGTSPQFELPERIARELLNGRELGDVIDKLTEIENSKHKFGAIGYFTNGVMDRKELYVSGLIAALVPFLNKKLYFNPQ